MLEIVVPLNSLKASDAALRCIELFSMDAGVAIDQVKLYGEWLNPSSLRRALAARQSFHVASDRFEFEMGSVTSYDHAFLEIDGVAPEKYTHWLTEFSTLTKVINGRVFDESYEHWQNAKNPKEYAESGKSTEGLSMKSNGLPPPLDQLIVDTTRNPGRRVLRNGYVEAIGHRMWLGSEFFVRTHGASRAELMSTPWVQIINDRTEDLIEIVVHSRPFVDATTAELQERLRRLLFGPDSGTDCRNLE